MKEIINETIDNDSNTRNKSFESSLTITIKE